MKPNEISEFILDTIEDIVYVSDPVTHVLYYLNGEGRRQFNFQDPNQWHRKPCYQVLQGFDKPCDFCTNRLLNQSAFHNWEYYNPVIKKHFLVQDRLIQFNGILARMEIAKDITNLKEMELELSVRLAKQQMLTHCAETLQSSLSPAQSIDQLLQLISTFYQAERGYVFDVTSERVSNNTYEWCAQGIEPQLEMLQNIPAEHTARWFEKFESQGGFYIDSLCDEVDTTSAEYEILSSQGISSLITAPLRNTDGQLIGFIGVDNPSKHRHDVETMVTVTRFIVDFFEKITLFDTLHKLSYGDGLTGLKNRNSYSGTIAQLRAQPPTTLGVVYVDINGLKLVNDKFGHTLGDQFILSVSTAIGHLFTDKAYRIGGDEFVVLWPGVSQETFQPMVDALMEQLRLGELSRASVGFTWSDNSQNIIRQIEASDTAMYAQKQRHHAYYTQTKEANALQYFWEHLKDDPRFQPYQREILEKIQGH